MEGNVRNIQEYVVNRVLKRMTAESLQLPRL